ncbi:hypothetical protein C2E23DRAFT_72062 [Lenzites betulinus]|nr:hypothetical protein C2E23DRAFT_72062 [Lenzites betulinus]
MTESDAESQVEAPESLQCACPAIRLNPYAGESRPCSTHVSHIPFTPFWFLDPPSPSQFRPVSVFCHGPNGCLVGPRLRSSRTRNCSRLAAYFTLVVPLPRQRRRRHHPPVRRPLLPATGPQLHTASSPASHRVVAGLTPRRRRPHTASSPASSPASTSASSRQCRPQRRRPPVIAGLNADVLASSPASTPTSSRQCRPQRRRPPVIAGLNAGVQAQRRRHCVLAGLIRVDGVLAFSASSSASSVTAWSSTSSHRARLCAGGS